MIKKYAKPVTNLFVFFILIVGFSISVPASSYCAEHDEVCKNSDTANDSVKLDSSAVSRVVIPIEDLRKLPDDPIDHESLKRAADSGGPLPGNYLPVLAVAYSALPEKIDDSMLARYLVTVEEKESEYVVHLRLALKPDAVVIGANTGIVRIRKKDHAILESYLTE